MTPTEKARETLRALLRRKRAELKRLDDATARKRLEVVQVEESIKALKGRAKVSTGKLSREELVRALRDVMGSRQMTPTEIDAGLEGLDIRRSRIHRDLSELEGVAVRRIRKGLYEVMT